MDTYIDRDRDFWMKALQNILNLGDGEVIRILLCTKLCPPKFICWSSKPQYLRTWLYVEIGFKEVTNIKGSHMGWPEPNQIGVPLRREY